MYLKVLMEMLYLLFFLEMPSSFAIVHFVKTNEIDIVPVKWFKNGMCYWPPCRNQEVPKMVKVLTDPLENWTLHKYKVIEMFGMLYIFMYQSYMSK